MRLAGPLWRLSSQPRGCPRHCWPLSGSCSMSRPGEAFVGVNQAQRLARFAPAGEAGGGKGGELVHVGPEGAFGFARGRGNPPRPFGHTQSAPALRVECAVIESVGPAWPLSCQAPPAPPGPPDGPRLGQAGLRRAGGSSCRSGRQAQQPTAGWAGEDGRSMAGSGDSRGREAVRSEAVSGFRRDSDQGVF